MDPAYYVAAGSLKARTLQLDLLASNLANTTTPSFKVGLPFFSSFNKAIQSSRRLPFSGPLNDGVVFGDTGTVMAQGALKTTGRAFDFALDGEGFFMVQTRAGVRATRDGRFQMGAGGLLTALDGSPVLGKNGQPITLDPLGGELSLGEDGSLQQVRKDSGNAQPTAVGELEIRNFEKAGNLKRSGELRYDPGQAKAIPSTAHLRQGVLEQSSVDMPSLMVEMVRLNRLFEMSMKVMSTLTNDLDARSINDVAVSR